MNICPASDEELAVCHYPANLSGPFEAWAKVLESCIQHFLKLRAYSGSKGHREVFAVAEMMLFVATIRYDLWIVGVDNEAAHRNYQRNLYCRVTATIITQAFHDLGGMWGKNIRPLFETHGSPELDAKAKDAIRTFNLLREKHHEAMNQVRCNTLAHRASDLDHLFRSLNTLEIEQIMDLNADCIVALDALANVLAELLHQTPAWHFWATQPDWINETGPFKK